MEKEKEENGIKVILLGGSGAGKTKIILSYMKDKFTLDENSFSTFGSTFVVKELKRGNTIYKLNIWDTTGQEKYSSVTKLFIKDANVVILVFSIDDKVSFYELDYWYKLALEACEIDNNPIFAVVANNAHLFEECDEDKEFITEWEGEEYANRINAIFRAVSVKYDRKGISQLFDDLLDEYIKRNTGFREVRNGIHLYKNSSENNHSDFEPSSFKNNIYLLNKYYSK